MPILLTWFGAGCALVYLTQIATGRPGEGHWQRSAAKTAATLALVVAALVSPAPGLIVLGLALGAAGDFFLSRHGQALFLAGMAAFAAGHLAYGAAFWSRAATLGFSGPTFAQSLELVLLWLAIFALGFWLSSRAGALRLPVFGYALVIGLMASCALILPAQPGGRTLQLGVGLFVLSDTLLALRLFVTPGGAMQKPLDLVVWPAYWLGQALIFAGAVIYWGFPTG